MTVSLRNGIKEYEQERNAPAKIFPEGTKARAVFTLGEAYEKEFDHPAIGLDFDKATQVVNFRVDLKVGDEQAVIYPKIALPTQLQDAGHDGKKARRGKAMLAALVCNKFGTCNDDDPRLEFDTFNQMLDALNEVSCTVELGVFSKAGQPARQYIKEVFLPPDVSSQPVQQPVAQPMPPMQQMPQQPAQYAPWPQQQAWQQPMPPWGANTAPQSAPPAGSPQANGWPIPQQQPDDIPF